MRDNYRLGNTMRTYALLLLALLTLTACSNPVVTTPTATIPAPIMTAEPSKTPEPSPTPEPKFADLLPKEWQTCLKQNSYPYSEKEKYHSIVIEKINNTQINPDNFSEMQTLITKPNTETQEFPFSDAVIIPNNGENPFKSCEVIEKDGHQIVNLGLVSKRSGSSIGEVMYYGMDFTALNEYRKTKDLEQYYFDDDYRKIASGDFKNINLELILWRGGAEQGGIWDHLLSLQPDLKLTTLENNDYEFKITMFTGQGGRDRSNNNKFVYTKDYGEQKLISELKKMILPVVSIWVK